MPLRVGLIGCGSIGTVIARAIDQGRVGGVKLVAIYDIVREHAETLAHKISRKPVICQSADELIAMNSIQLVVEAASQQAVKEYALKVLDANKDLMVMSVGALLEEELYSQIVDLARKKGRRVYVPSGAIVGLDNVKSAALGEVYEAYLTTRKPPSSFEGNAYIQERKINLNAIKKPTILYEGKAREAVKLFPRNANVAASLSLAGTGPDKTKVKIIADPRIKEIIHEIKLRGEFGQLETRTINKPFPENPKTSYIAALSAIATLKRIAGNIIIGT